MRATKRLTGGVTIAAALVTAGMAIGAGPASAATTVTAVRGSAFGYYASISLFGGPQNVRGPSPTVALAANASNSPQAASAPTGDAIVGPAQFFTSGQLDVTTTGSLGPSGSVTTTTTIQNVNRLGSESFTATNVSSTCTASATGVSGSTTVTNGSLDTDSGDDLNGDGDFTDPGEHAPTTVLVPGNPAPNTGIAGHIHVNGVVETFNYRFNEQEVNADGLLTVYVGHEYLFGPTAVGDLYIGKAECGVTAVVTAGAPPADFDGDGDTDRSVFRNGAWYAQDQPTAFLGVGGDIPVPANYDGDTNTERAVYRNGAWFVDGVPTVFLGTAGDIPVPGDYNGDGIVERAVYRPSVGGWYVDGAAPVFFGLASDIPVPGDYDGNGTTDRAVWRPSVGGWYVQGQTTVFLGLNGDIPVPGDYDGNARTDRAVWRPSVGGWYVQGQTTVFLGLQGDIPVPGDYDGNRTTDRAIWRPSVGGWYVQGQPTVFLGLQGDIPLPLPQAIYRAFF